MAGVRPVPVWSSNDYILAVGAMMGKLKADSDAIKISVTGPPGKTTVEVTAMVNGRAVDTVKGAVRSDPSQILFKFGSSPVSRDPDQTLQYVIKKPILAALLIVRDWERIADTLPRQKDPSPLVRGGVLPNYVDLASRILSRYCAQEIRAVLINKDGRETPVKFREYDLPKISQLEKTARRATI